MPFATEADCTTGHAFDEINGTLLEKKSSTKPSEKYKLSAIKATATTSRYCLTNQAFIDPPINQAMAEEKVSHAETIITRVERLEQVFPTKCIQYFKGCLIGKRGTSRLNLATPHSSHRTQPPPLLPLLSLSPLSKRFTYSPYMSCLVRFQR